MTNDSIGIDISKDKLDVHRLCDDAFAQFPNSQKGFRALVNWIGAVAPERVVYEATGAYHGALERFLSEQLPLVKVNPLKAKRFSQSQGARAKTDKADAKMLAQMGTALGLEPDRPQDKDHHILRELQTTRTGLVKAKVQARNQLAQQTLSLTQGLTRTRIRQIEGQIKKVDAEINARLAASEKRKQALEIIKSIPGLGNVVANTILIEMPEIGTLSNKATAALTGLAPFTRHSGQWKGRAFIQGGRKPLRDALYMPALVAIRYNPDLKRKYKNLKAAGKPSKVALVVIMRKLIELANTLIKENRKWTQNHA